jgi:DNA-binding NarL/FixJ family response regulator
VILITDSVTGSLLAYDEASGDGCFVNSHDEVPLTNSPIQVLIVDDYEPWRRFASSTFQKMPGLQVVGEVSDGLQAVQKSEELQPDLILLDIALPTINGIEAARQIRKHSPRSKILFFSEERSPDIAKEALRTGATGYVLKSDAAGELLPAIQAVLQGEYFVSSSLAAQVALKTTGERMLVDSVVPLVSENVQITLRHDVALYRDDVLLVDGFVRFVESVLKLGNSAVVIATASHRTAILQKLREFVDVDAAIEQGRYVERDINDTLSVFEIANLHDAVRVRKSAADLFEEAAKAAQREHRRVAVCREGAPKSIPEANAEAVISQEDVFEEIAKRYDVDLLCGYVLSAFPSKDRTQIIRRICAAHSGVWEA